jgi:FG-GAP repeat
MLREFPLNANGQGAMQYWNDFSSSAAIFMRDVKPAWDVQVVGDMDGDGLGDMVWRFRGMSPNIDDQGVSYIWFTGTGGTSVAQVRKRGGAPLTWTLLGAADLNGDRAADMVYVSPSNTMRVLMATPNRTCANLNGGSIPAGFTALKLADFAGSGRGDVLIRNAGTGEVSLIRLNALGLALPPYTGAPDDPNASCTSSTLSVVQSVVSLGTTDPSWTLYVTGDFNGDGVHDIVWRRPAGTLTVWLLPKAGSGGARVDIASAGTAPAGATPLPLQ